MFASVGARDAWRDVQWWQVYPLGALGADTTGRREFEGQPLSALIPWLYHARDLGCNGLALGPIFAAELHGYDTLDYFEVDPRLGTRTDFDTLVGAAHDAGFKVMLDGVFNHVSKNSPLARHGLLRYEGDSPACFEGHGQLLELDHASTEVEQLVADVMQFWLDAGADGWRLDAAYAVPTDFWRRVLDRVKLTHPDAYFMAEVIHGDYGKFVAGSGVDTVTQYELWKSIWSSINDRNMHELAWTLTRHNGFCSQFLPWTFVSNHDVTRIASKVSPRDLPVATALLCALPGIPAVYYGDELGWEGVKEERFGGDDAIRPPLPKFPPAAKSRPDVFHQYQQLLGLRRRVPHLARTEQLVVDGGAIAFTVFDEGGTPVLDFAGFVGDGDYVFDLPGAATFGDRCEDLGDHVRLFAGGWYVRQR